MNASIHNLAITIRLDGTSDDEQMTTAVQMLALLVETLADNSVTVVSASAATPKV